MTPHRVTGRGRGNHVGSVITWRKLASRAVLRAAPRQRNVAAGTWVCRCDCGTVKTYVPGNLRGKNPQVSCGCFRDEKATKHGGSNGHHPLYSTWVGMRQRCNRVSHRQYANYGGRRIKVDPRWDDFAQFVADMGPKPSPNHTLDRIDNDGPYSPANCKWASRYVQNANRRPRLLPRGGEAEFVRTYAARHNISTAEAISRAIALLTD